MLSVIFKIESGWVGYRKEYWVAGGVWVPVGHWLTNTWTKLWVGKYFWSPDPDPTKTETMTKTYPTSPRSIPDAAMVGGKQVPSQLFLRW